MGVAEARGGGQGGWVLMLEHPMSRHSPSSGGSCELDPLPAEICAAADWGAWAAGRLLPAGHPSLWSFPSYSRTLTPWAITARRLKPSHALQSAALSCPAGRVKDADVCPLPMALSPFTSLAFSCMCEAQGMDGECVPPTPQEPRQCPSQACSLWSAPFPTCRLKWDFRPGENSSGARGSLWAQTRSFDLD